MVRVRVRLGDTTTNSEAQGDDSIDTIIPRVRGWLGLGLRLGIELGLELELDLELGLRSVLFSRYITSNSEAQGDDSIDTIIPRVRVRVVRVRVRLRDTTTNSEAQGDDTIDTIIPRVRVRIVRVRIKV
jgi:hypothetical protein